jgi:F0F1-type ATP synthase assembly protein I
LQLPRKFHACYTFPALWGGFQDIGSRSGRIRASKVSPGHKSSLSRVHDPITAGRRSALRAAAIQAAVAVPVALAFLFQGVPAALAALAGGLALAAGNAAAAWLSLRGIERAPVAFARLLAGTLAKWCVVVVVLAAALQVWRLPPLPLLCGLAVSLVAYLLAMNMSRTGASMPVRME